MRALVTYISVSRQQSRSIRALVTHISVPRPQIRGIRALVTHISVSRQQSRGIRALVTHIHPNIKLLFNFKPDSANDSNQSAHAHGGDVMATSSSQLQ